MTDEQRRRLADLPCNEFVELMTSYLDGVLSPDLQARVDDHLELCEGCQNVLDQWRAVIELSGRLTETDLDDVDPDTRRRLMAAFRDLRSR